MEIKRFFIGLIICALIVGAFGLVGFAEDYYIEKNCEVVKVISNGVEIKTDDGEIYAVLDNDLTIGQKVDLIMIYNHTNTVEDY